jgi:hypothetical protein
MTDGNKFVGWYIFSWVMGIIVVVIGWYGVWIARIDAKTTENQEAIRNVKELILDRLSSIESDTAVTKEQIIRIQQDIQELNKSIK